MLAIALAEGGQGAAELGHVIRVALEPHLPGSERFSVSGPGIVVGPKQATSIALVMHELATNAAKHGALSNDTGRIDLAWSVDGEMFRMEWKECDGPRVVKSDRVGFGSRLIKGILVHEFGGTIEPKYDPDGLSVTFAFPAGHLTRDGS
jgi:two-component sensor histidine kinase